MTQHRESRSKKYDVIVVGAGVSGLACANYLSGKGHSVLVLEGRDRTGGRIYSKDTGHGDEKVDIGASYVHGIFDNPIFDLADEVGLELVDAQEGLVGISPSGQLNPELIEQIGGNVLATFFSHSKTESSLTDPPSTMSLGDYIFQSDSPIYHHLPSDPAKFWAECLCRTFSGWTGSELDHVSFKWWGFERDTLGPDRMVVRGWYHKLIQHLEKGVEEIKLEHKVVKVIDDDKSIEVQVETKDGFKTFQAKHVICSLPLGVLREHSKTMFVPELPPRKSQAIERLGFGLLSKIVLRYDTPWWTTSDEWSNSSIFFLLPDLDQPRSVLPPGAPSSLSPRGVMVLNYDHLCQEPILLMFLGADLGRYVETLPSKEATEWAHDLIQRYLRPHSPVTKPTSIVTSWSTDPYSLGAYTYIPPNGSTPLDLSEFIVPAWDGKLGFAGEHTHPDRYASVHGAYESGVREGKRVDIALTLEGME